VTHDVSVVVPAYNEAESLPELVEQVRTVLGPRGKPWELIVVDDGSPLTAPCSGICHRVPELRYRSLLRNYGKSAAFRRIRGSAGNA
jgi:glycosyltransferase involved in cell wall biosynthesis